MSERTHADVRFNIFSISTVIVLLFSRINGEFNRGTSTHDLTLEKDLIVALPGNNLTIVWLYSSKILPTTITFDVGNSIHSQTLWELEVISESQTKQPSKIEHLVDPYKIFINRTEVKYSKGRFELILNNVPRNITNYTFSCSVQQDKVGFVKIELATKVKLADFCTVRNPCQNGANCTTLPVNSKPCNNGTCTDRKNSYECNCVEGFSGINCEINIDDCLGISCQNNGTCIDGVNAYGCNCLTGFTGLHCEVDTNECISNPCRHGKCVDRTNSYKCICDNGFQGPRCMENIDECPTSNCLNGGKCIDRINSYTCSCTAYYTGNHCETRLSKPCHPSPCKNQAGCQEIAKTQTSRCLCPKGYGGNLCELYYENNAVSVIIQNKENKPFNHTSFKTGVTRAMNDYCQQNLALCPKKTFISRYIFKPDDVHFLPGYPKYLKNGVVEARFFVATKQTRFAGSDANTTHSPVTRQPVTPVVIKVNTVVTAIQTSTDVFQQDLGIEIESLKVIQMRDTKKPKEGNNITMLIVVVSICLVVVLGMFVLLAIWIRRRRNSHTDETKKAYGIEIHEVFNQEERLMEDINSR